MPLGSRTRDTGLLTTSGGSALKNGVILSGGSVSKQRILCQDVVNKMPYPDSPFNKKEWIYPLVYSNGDNGLVGIPKRTCTNWVAAGSVIMPSHNSLGAISDATVATWAAARTNPGRPSVSIPVFLAELRDFPRMLRDLGDYYRRLNNFRRKPSPALLSDRNLSGYFLNYEFGWAPFISDLMKMINFSETVDKRLRELENLRNRGGLSRKLRYLSDNSTSSSTANIESNMYFMSGLRTWTTTRDIWAVVKWVPAPGLIKLGHHELRSKMRDVVLGLDSAQAIANLWNALPWTWLIDWFADVGDYLQASNNSIAYLSGGVNVMRHTRTDLILSNMSPPSWVTLSGGRGYLDEKARGISTPSPISATLPIVNGRQLSILAALNIARMRS